MNLEKGSTFGPADWPTQFTLVLWWIWKWRNQVLFGRQNEVPENKAKFLEDKVQETKAALDREYNGILNRNNKHQILISWPAPPIGWIALNTDGAAKGCPGAAGGGGILRDCTGQCVGAFSQALGHCTAIRAEFLALLTGLEMAWDKNVKYLDVRMDNKACIQILMSEQEHIGPNMQTVRMCKTFMAKEDWTVTLTHSYREANRAADWLANRGISHGTASYTDHNLPSGLYNILIEDLQGVALPRHVPTGP